MSELDINSDSDWLDISSGRDSDDNDSLTDQDSDHDEINSVPRSRRSSFSTESSMGGDVEAWEGFVSDSGDEVPHALNGMYSVAFPSTITRAELLPVRLTVDATDIVDPAIVEEDQRVKEALDQSFVGTLSASRASSAGMHNSSTHTSIRDLRLSFPDPLTSSRNELNRSYEDVPSPVGSDLSSSVEYKTDSTTELHVTASSPPRRDPGSLITTPEVQGNEHKDFDYEGVTQLDIVLYGTSSSTKWTFVHDLIQKAISASGHDIINNLQEDMEIQSLRLARKTNSDLMFFETINIIDRTGESREKTEFDYDTPSGRPSLAIVYLPTARLPLITWHDAFLPVLIPSDPEVESQNTVMLHVAEDDWDLLAVPIGRTLQFAEDSLVFDSKKVSELRPSTVYELLYNIGQESKTVAHAKPLKEKIKMNPMTIVGIMSVVMGFAVNTMLHSPTPSPTPTVNAPSSNSQVLQSLIPLVNHSVAGPSTSFQQAKGCGMSSAFDQLALSVYDARSTSISTIASSSQANDAPSTPSTHRCKQCSKTPMDVQKASTDIVIRSQSTSLSQIPGTKSSLTTVSSSQAVATTSVVPSNMAKFTTAAASTSSVGRNGHHYKTNSETLDASAKALTSDFTDMAVVADDLLSSFIQQTDNVIRQSKGKARALTEQIRNLNEEVISRNERAKKRAKELRKKGRDIVRVARDELRERTDKAKRRAKHLSDTVIESGCDAWCAYGAQLTEKVGKEGLDRKLSRKRRERYEKWQKKCEQRKLEREKRESLAENKGQMGGCTYWKNFRARHQRF